MTNSLADIGSNARRRARLLDTSGKAYLDAEWLQSAIITEQVADFNAAAFPEMALARERAARLREVEARNGC